MNRLGSIRLVCTLRTKGNIAGKPDGDWETRAESYRTMEKDYEVEEKKQAAADVLFHYSTFVMACLANQVSPSNLRLHLMKEISGLPTSLKKTNSRYAKSYLPDLLRR
ncbi:hypothetical protein U1Q18_041209 [Sarracenia purpurea var. burkii]